MLEVFHNGGYRLTAGVGRLGILHSVIELDRGIPRYYLQGLENPDELVVWNTPEIELGDELSVKIIETEQAPTEPSIRIVRKPGHERSSVGGFLDIVGKHDHVLASPSEYLTSTLVDGRSTTKAIKVFHNGQHAVTAGIPGNAGYLDWFVEFYSVMLNHILKGIDCQASEHVEWSTPTIRVGDEVRVRIVETEEIAAASRRFGTHG